MYISYIKMYSHEFFFFDKMNKPQNLLKTKKETTQPVWLLYIYIYTVKWGGLSLNLH